MEQPKRVKIQSKVSGYFSIFCLFGKRSERERGGRRRKIIIMLSKTFWKLFSISFTLGLGEGSEEHDREKSKDEARKGI
jgi:hypothetical protein